MKSLFAAVAIVAAGASHSQSQFISLRCSGYIGYVSANHWDVDVGVPYEVEFTCEFDPTDPRMDWRGATVWDGPGTITLNVGDEPTIQYDVGCYIYVGDDIFASDRRAIQFDVTFGPSNNRDRVIVELVAAAGQDVLDPALPPTAADINAIPLSSASALIDGFSLYNASGLFYELYGSIQSFQASDVPCTADTNGDGAVTPADFSAWVAAFNAQASACDQNGDGQCSPADFSAWVANYNAGC